MAGVKKFLDFFVKIEPDAEGHNLSDDELQKILAEDDAAAGAKAPPTAPPRRIAPPGPGVPTASPPRVSAVAAPVVFQVKAPAPGAATPEDLPDFETIYKAAKIPLPAHGYSVDRVESMLANPRLAGMSEGVKANSVLMALEVAGVAISDVVADAVARDRAIDDFEGWWAARVSQLETDKRAENTAIDDEMNRYLEAQRERIRGNNAAVQKAVETFAAWKDRKRQEEHRLYQTVAPFVTENPITLNTGMVAPAGGPAPGFGTAPAAAPKGTVPPDAPSASGKGSR